MKLLLTTSLCLILCNLTGCAPDPSPTTITASTTPFPVITATSTSLPTSTPTITLTPTPTVTPTITLTPTPDTQTVISNLINEFNLNPQRQYEITTSDGKQYLADIFNGEKVAEFNLLNQSLEIVSELDVRFEKILSHNRDYPYLGWHGNVNFSGLGDDFHLMDNRYHYYRMLPQWTGNWNEIEWINPVSGEEITVVTLQTIFKDIDGRSRLMDFSIGSPDLMEKVWFYYQIKVSDNTYTNPYPFLGSPYEIISQLEPGQQITFDFHYEKPDNGYLPERCVSEGDCTQQYNNAHYQFIERQDRINKWVEWLKSTDENKTPYEDLETPDFIPLYRAGLHTIQK